MFHRLFPSASFPAAVEEAVRKAKNKLNKSHAVTGQIKTTIAIYSEFDKKLEPLLKGEQRDFQAMPDPTKKYKDRFKSEGAVKVET